VYFAYRLFAGFDVEIAGKVAVVRGGGVGGLSP
jgi:hypothetical protein